VANAERTNTLAARRKSATGVILGLAGRHVNPPGKAWSSLRMDRAEAVLYHLGRDRSADLMASHLVEAPVDAAVHARVIHVV
jgi:hypothetical protein